MIRPRADARLLWRAARSARAPGPFKLTVALTWVCDQRCVHCGIWRRPRSDELDAGEWRAVFRAVRDTLCWVDLTGGELTTRADAAEVAAAAIEECPHLALVHFPSNGRRPDRVLRAARAILAARPERLIVSLSLDGPPDTHDRLRGDPGSWHRVLDTYRRLRALGVETYLGMTLSPHNVETLEDTVRAVQAEVPAFGWRDLHVNFVHRSPHHFDNTERVSPPDPERLRAAIRRLLARRGPPRAPTHLLEHLYLALVPVHLRSGQSPVPCSSLTGNAYVAPEGTVYPCTIWDAPIGNLRRVDYDLKRLWALPEAKRLRAEVAAQRCPGCWTPCEAYPSILAHLPRTTRALVTAQRSGATGSEPGASSTAGERPPARGWRPACPRCRASPRCACP